jgi:OmpA-OmpF porin, OOP family
MSGKKTFAGIAMLALAGIAHADDALPRPQYLAFVGGYSYPQEREFDTRGNGVNFAAIWGVPFKQRFAFETRAFGAIFETGRWDKVDYYQTALEFDLVYALRRDPGTHFTPFLMVGAGIARDDLYPDNRDDTVPIYTAGLGFSTKPLTNLGFSVRFGARYVYDTVESGIYEPQISLGVQFPLWPRERHASAPELRIETRTVETLREVPRKWVDTDGDGVDDEHDRCPGTPAGLRADAQGCVIENQKVELAGVTFEFNQARLTPNAMAVLDLISRGLVGQPDMRFEIAGHTDSVGKAAANQNLSERRANSVRTYLISKGVSPEHLTAVGYGESQLLVDPETTPQDGERNRRVELRVLSAGPSQGK